MILVFLSNVPSCAALDDFTEMNNDNKSTAKKFISVVSLFSRSKDNGFNSRSDNVENGNTSFRYLGFVQH